MPHISQYRRDMVECVNPSWLGLVDRLQEAEAKLQEEIFIKTSEEALKEGRGSQQIAALNDLKEIRDSCKNHDQIVDLLNVTISHLSPIVYIFAFLPVSYALTNTLTSQRTFDFKKFVDDGNDYFNIIPQIIPTSPVNANCTLADLGANAMRPLGAAISLLAHLANNIDLTGIAAGQQIDNLQFVFEDMKTFMEVSKTDRDFRKLLDLHIRKGSQRA